MNELNVVVNNGSIICNFEEVKADLQQMMSAYEGIEYTEETVKTAKADVATLRKIKTAFDTRRKEVKKECLKPYEEFEVVAKELISIIDNPINTISGQVSAFETKRKDERKQLINNIYAENIGDMGKYIPLSKVYDSKWENVATSKKAIKDAITEKCEQVRKDLDGIRSINTECTDKAIEKYLVAYDLTAAINYINQYEAQKSEIIKAEEARKEREAKQAEEKAIRDVEEAKQLEQQIAEELKEDPEPVKKDNSIFTVTGTKEDFDNIEIFLNSIGVEFERSDF